jgi:hypothetical protein
MNARARELFETADDRGVRTDAWDAACSATYVGRYAIRPVLHRDHLVGYAINVWSHQRQMYEPVNKVFTRYEDAALALTLIRDRDPPLRAARGIVNGILASVVLWAIAFGIVALLVS